MGERPQEGEGQLHVQQRRRLLRRVREQRQARQRRPEEDRRRGEDRGLEGWKAHQLQDHQGEIRQRKITDRLNVTAPKWQIFKT